MRSIPALKGRAPVTLCSIGASQEPTRKIFHAISKLPSPSVPFLTPLNALSLTTPFALFAQGRPLYEKKGFRVAGWCEAEDPGTPGAPGTVNELTLRFAAMLRPATSERDELAAYASLS